MTPELFKYIVMFFYLGATLWLSWLGMRKTQTIAGFAIGNRDMSPVLVGITLATSVASTATFVINPGFVFVHGVSAYLHFGIAASSGILAALILLTKGFNRIGAANGAITIPDWIQRHYGSRALTLLFALLNLLSITFVVLILVGCSLLIAGLFPISQQLALVLVLLFVFSYVLMGGTYAHAYTNTLQGVLMVVISIVLVVQGWHHFAGNPLATLAQFGDNYTAIYNPDSSLYYSFFSVFVSGFVITFALMMQPHILTKALYLKSERDTRRFIWTAAIVGIIFSQMLLLGFYAKIAGIQPPSQDQVLITYLIAEYSSSALSQYFIAFVLIALLAAGMSTLDGILVSLSAMVANDIYLPLRKGGSTRSALTLSRYILVVIGIIAGALAWNPPALVGLFAQQGVYGLGAASFVPILFGVLLREPLSARVALSCAVVGIGGHLLSPLVFNIANPAVSATIGIAASLSSALLALARRTVKLGRD